MPAVSAVFRPPAVRTVPLGVLSAAVLLTGCTSTASVEPAPEAAHPDCAEVMLYLPEEIAGHSQRPTDSQATSVWGDPAEVVLRCGVEPPGPSPELCVSAGEIDWMTIELEDDDADTDIWQLVSYGREPAVEVVLDVAQTPSSTVMLELASAVGQVEQTRECTEVEQDISDP
ncbi:DUF3515 family protein [Nesterenkonia alba]|uniref:DUF3515 family protein n=1 Tax=Nesterenkonia alba TaxID=515814 RepID=UPI0003B58A9D|nr:DUF3515 family protein [Nesterenkonia alba]